MLIFLISQNYIIFNDKWNTFIKIPLLINYTVVDKLRVTKSFMSKMKIKSDESIYRLN